MYRRVLSIIVVAAMAISPGESGLSMEQMVKAANGVRNACVQKLNVDLSLVEGIRTGQFSDDPSAKCYTECVMKKVQTFKNGVLNMDMLLKQVDIMMPDEIKERVKAVAKSCAETPASDDPCETTQRFVKCNYETDPEVFFFP